MIWTTWRQHRAELLVVGITLAILTVVLVVTGIQMANAYTSLGVATCAAQTVTTANCGTIVGTFRDEFGWLESASGWLNLVPALLAMLIGAPLVAREMENRTHLLAWTQGVTRRRWLATKVVFVIGSMLLVSALLTGVLTWWHAPFDALQGRLVPIAFDFEGIVPFAYVAFALALAIAAGTLLRRSIPAMVATLALFLAVRLPLEFWARSYLYETPITLATDPVSGAFPTHQDWQVQSGFVDQAGHSLSGQQVFSACAPQGNIVSKANVLQCMHTHGWLFTYVYQPADRFWRFQITEGLIYLALALVLVGLTFWWTQRRIR